MQNHDTGSPRGLRCPYGVTDQQQGQMDRIEAEMREILGEADSESRTRAPRGPDRHAIDDERVFIHRFGFDWPRCDRIAVIALKHQFDLTGREIRLLRWTGNLKRKNGVVTLASTRWAALFGRGLALVVWLEFIAIMLLQIATMHHAISALQALKLYGATATVLVVLWLIHLGYIKPWIIQQRVMRRDMPDASRGSVG